MTDITPALGLSAYLLGKRITGQRPMRPIPTAFLYDDNSLVFQSHQEPDPNKTVVASFTGWLTETYSGAYNPPWNKIADLDYVYPRPTSVIINDDVFPKSIAHWFHYHNDLTSVKLGKGITSIDDSAFYGTSKLKTLELPDGLEQIGYRAFFQGYDQGGLSSIVLPESLRIIRYEAFTGCEFETINIPDSVTSIGARAFRYCKQLKEFTIPDGVTLVTSTMCSSCESLANVHIGSGVKTIGEFAFNDCFSLTEVVIPAGVTRIEMAAFCDCSALTSITFEDPTGWWYSTDEDATSGTGIDFSDPVKNVEILTAGYQSDGSGFYFCYFNKS